ncbi:MAG: radical SAM protein [Chloroflexi bacterium]|nr:radical SAM protein [Chloroflexota bacterium]
MRVLLVEPPFQRFMGFKCDWYPLGLGYLGGALLQRGHEVRIYNAEFHRQPQYLSSSRLLKTFDLYTEALKDEGHPVWREAAETIRTYRPDVVGITSRTVKFASACRIARLCKEHDPHIPVILGGQHPTIQTEEVLKNPDVDFVARGEGEETLVQLVEALEKGRGGEEIDGLSYCRNGEMAHNPPRELISNLDALPFPAREALVDREAYDPEAMGNIFTSRGCPFSCAYCSAHLIWTRRVRYRSIDNVMAEIKHVRDTYGTKQITFWDDSFTVNRERVHDLCRALRQEGRDIYWSCNTRFDLIDEEMVREMKAAGCNNIELGVESGSAQVLQFIDKGLTLEKIREAARILNKHDIYWSAFFMIGLPNETKEDIQETLKLMKEIKPHWSTYSIFTPYPGTKLYQISRDMGLIPETMDWSQYGHQSPHNRFTANLSAKDMAQMAELAAREFDRYNRQPRLLLKKALSRSRLYLASPRELVGDVGKLTNWLGWGKSPAESQRTPWAMEDSLPFISVVIPMRNEKKYIAHCLNSVFSQDYPSDRMEVLVMDGMSTDGSREEVLRLAEEHPGVRLVDNPRKITPCAFNVGVQNAKGEKVVWVSAHSVLETDHLKKCIYYLRKTGAWNVGGLMVGIGRNYIGSAVALVIGSRFGVGDARYRYSSREQFADTVYAGAFPKEVFDRVGLFDETMVRGQDYDFNHRIRQAGGRVFFTPAIKTYYYCRDSLPGLAKQYFQYGMWRTHLMRKHHSLLPRQMAAPGLILILAASGLLFWTTPIVAWLFAAVLLIYLLAAVSFSAPLAAKGGWRYLPILPLVFMIIHMAWGLGFWRGLAEGFPERR